MSNPNDAFRAEAIRQLKAAGGQMVVNGRLFALDEHDKIMVTRAPVEVDPATNRIKITLPKGE